MQRYTFLIRSMAAAAVLVAGCCYAQNAPPITPMSGLCRVEMVFLIDRSYFTPHTYEVFVRPLITAFRQSTPSVIALQQAFVEYASSAYARVNFNDYLSVVAPRTTMDSWTLSTVDLGAEADVGNALQFTRSQILTPSAGHDRTKAVFVVIFAGNDPVDQEKAEREAYWLKNSGAVVVVSAFGFGTYNRTKLTKLASYDKMFVEYPSNNMGDIDQLVQTYFQLVCPPLFSLKRSPPQITTTPVYLYLQNLSRQRQQQPQQQQQQQQQPAQLPLCNGMNWEHCIQRPSYDVY